MSNDKEKKEIETVQVTTVETTVIKHDDGSEEVTVKTKIGPCTNPNRPC